MTKAKAFESRSALIALSRLIVEKLFSSLIIVRLIAEAFVT
jgi:hypothetical protein